MHRKVCGVDHQRGVDKTLQAKLGTAVMEGRTNKFRQVWGAMLDRFGLGQE